MSGKGSHNRKTELKLQYLHKNPLFLCEQPDDDLLNGRNTQFYR